MRTERGIVVGVWYEAIETTKFGDVDPQWVLGPRYVSVRFAGGETDFLSDDLSPGDTVERVVAKLTVPT